ncbi:MAG: hypothetical protein ACW99G_17500 [Candidatus Thorarchaeota archaeon]|jgi:hypothetical protein
MALTFTTGMTPIDPADTVTNWAAFKITAGGGTPTANLDTDQQREGVGCIGVKPTRNKDCGVSYDYYTANGSTTLNLSTSGNEVLAIWIKSTAPGQILTRANAGVTIIVCASNGVPTASNDWAKWYVAGSDSNPADWQLFLVDTRKTPSATNGAWSGTSLQNIYQIGITAFAADVAVARVDNIYIDAMWYGRPVYTLTGDGVLTADWADFLSDADTNANGLIQDINGAYEVSCGIQIGDDAQTATTTFDDDTSQNLNWKRHVYDTGSGVVDALIYSDYYKFSVEGAASFNTSVTLGNVVGTNAGILGGTLRSLDPVNAPVIVDFDTDKDHISALNLYGVVWQGITGSFKIGDKTAYKIYSNQFIGCGQIDPVGACVIRNCLFINTASLVGSLLWNDDINIQLCSFIANDKAIEHQSHYQSPFDYVNLTFSGNTCDTYNSSGSYTTTSTTTTTTTT